MKQIESAGAKICTLQELIMEVKRWRLSGKTVAFTNGVFDLLHEGHLYSLQQAAGQADMLIVAVNGDAGVRKLKGESRPVQPEATRLHILAALLYTDAVICFEEDTPIEIITAILPDVLVKGGDYTVEQIAGAKEVIEAGGKVILANMIDGISTTKQIEKLNASS